MGYFSWLTSDTGRTISNEDSSRPTFTVYMITEDGRAWKEDNYKGYGVFGGKDIYELITELNNLPYENKEDEAKRLASINLIHDLDGGYGDFEFASRQGYKLPKLVENPNVKFSEVPYPKCCPDQGFFYGDEEDNDFDSWAEEFNEWPEDE